jgi:hypothetical protein
MKKKKFSFVPVERPDLRVWQEETLSDTAPPLPSMKLRPFKGTKLGRSKEGFKGPDLEVRNGFMPHSIYILR